MASSYLKDLVDIYPKLSTSEKIFADYVLRQPEDLIKTSIHDVSKELGVSVSTIISMIKKTGLEGYAELKLQLAGEANNPMRSQSWDSLIEKEDGEIQDIYSNVVDSNIKALSQSKEYVNYKDLRYAAELISRAPRVCFFGTGSSSLLVAEAHDLLFRLGLNCCYNQDRDHQMITAACMKEDEIAIMISQTGVNVDNLKLASILMNQGVRIIGISNYSGTPFSKMTTVNLAPLGGGEQEFGSHFTLRIPIFCIIEALYYTLIDVIGDEAKETARKVREIAVSSSL